MSIGLVWEMYTFLHIENVFLMKFYEIQTEFTIFKQNIKKLSDVTNLARGKSFEIKWKLVFIFTFFAGTSDGEASCAFMKPFNGFKLPPDDRRDTVVVDVNFILMTSLPLFD